MEVVNTKGELWVKLVLAGSTVLKKVHIILVRVASEVLLRGLATSRLCTSAINDTGSGNVLDPLLLEHR